MKWITLIAFALSAAAQERVFFRGDVKNGFSFTEAKVVTGAPYSAQAVTETTQVLADGNRITHKLTSTIARDSLGRTRNEQSLAAVGPWSSLENNNGLVFIVDPVASTRYTLETGSKVAVKNSFNPAQVRERHAVEVKMKESAQLKKEEAEAGAQHVVIANEPRTATSNESLGTRMFDGVPAEGHRVTETIPAGRIGNEKPIQVVNETWYSAELQTVVMSKHSDPRGGDVVYTLTNISRAEPDASLFAIPQDYKVREDGGVSVRVHE